MSDTEYDLVVVGSGFAGSMTTLNFLEQCKKLGRPGKVCLIESGREDERCGASRWTMAYLRLDKNNDFDADWIKEMDLVGKGLCDVEYCQKLGVEAPITAQYLIDHGVQLNHHDEENVLIEFKTNQHFVFPEGGGYAIIKKLIAAIQSYDNADILWQTQANKLIVNEDGSMGGVKARGLDGKFRNIKGKNVMLACGGFEGNREMLARYIGNRTHDLPLIAPGLVHNTGLGLQMALEVGAATAGSFDGMHCELVDRRAGKPDAVIWGHNYGIVVNDDCKRFYDEGKRHLFATFEMIALECWRDQNQSCYFVTDSTIMNRFRPGWVFDTTDKEPEESDTIEGLAEKLGLDPKKLKETVDRFNSAVNDKPFDLMKLDGKATTGLSPNKTNWANKIDNGPFYGYPLTSNLTFTYGGIKTNTKAEVLALGSNVPIPGLYATGELTGLFYNEYPPATSVLRSLTFGRIAGTEIAQKV